MPIYLEEIVDKKRLRIKERGLKLEECKEKAKEQISVPKISIPKITFYEALKKEGLSIIGEIKKASPSKGLIKEDFQPLVLAKEYETSVDAVSVLTEEDYFLGKDEYLEEVSREISLPTLCKDFIIDQIQIYQAKVLGASCILLIVNILSDEQLCDYLALAEELGMDSLVEVHTRDELFRALATKAKIIGINNRDLKSFKTSLEITKELAPFVPKDRLVVSESGIMSPEDVASLEGVRVDAILVGENFMRAASISEAAASLRKARRDIVSPELKICGIKTEAEVAILNEFPVHYAGFIFAPSKRKVSIETCIALGKKLRKGIRKVGVFVNEPLESLLEIAKACDLDVIQLHGEETVDYIKKIPYKVWKTIAIRNAESLEQITVYEDVVDGILFETYHEKLKGGTGQSFDWSLFPKENKSYQRILAGGIKPENIKEAIGMALPDVVDANSGVETEGYKTFEQIEKLVKEMEI